MREGIQQILGAQVQLDGVPGIVRNVGTATRLVTDLEQCKTWASGPLATDRRFLAQGSYRNSEAQVHIDGGLGIVRNIVTETRLVTDLEQQKLGAP